MFNICIYLRVDLLNLAITIRLIHVTNTTLNSNTLAHTHIHITMPIFMHSHPQASLLTLMHTINHKPMHIATHANIKREYNHIYTHARIQTYSRTAGLYIIFFIYFRQVCTIESVCLYYVMYKYCR